MHNNIYVSVDKFGDIYFRYYNLSMCIGNAQWKASQPTGINISYNNDYSRNTCRPPGERYRMLRAALAMLEYAHNCMIGRTLELYVWNSDKCEIQRRRAIGLVIDGLKWDNDEESGLAHSSVKPLAPLKARFSTNFNFVPSPRASLLCAAK